MTWVGPDFNRSSIHGANPSNAVSNYLYAILEAEARLAAAELGLDPGLGRFAQRHAQQGQSGM
jgi:CRISPR/Cas system-associated endonuclease Cas1